MSFPTPSLDAGAIASQKPHEIFDNIYKPLPSNIKNENPRHLTPYRLRYDNWFKTIPYALRIVSVNDSGLPSNIGSLAPESGPMYYFFPVNPESITISTPYAVQVTPTIGGIVEEHSGAVFYNINISGTTGVIPALDFSNGIPRDVKNNMRPLAAQDGLIPAGALGGFGASTINAINSIASTLMGTSSKLVKLNEATNINSGYTAFHVLYKFIWLYHFAKANGAKYQLKFLNYKDNNQYNVVVQNFQLTRDKGKPHLYQYSIVMRGWLLATTDGTPSFANADRLKQLGLDEGPSLKAKIFRAITATKSVLNGAAGLLNAAAQDLAF